MSIATITQTTKEESVRHIGAMAKDTVTVKGKVTAKATAHPRRKVRTLMAVPKMTGTGRPRVTTPKVGTGAAIEGVPKAAEAVAATEADHGVVAAADADLY